jgi:flagellar protein FliS
MFTPRHFANAYRQVGVQTGVNSATPHRLVAMLYEGFMEAIATARGALRDGRVEVKGRAIGHAARIVEEGLKAGLNLKDGGKLAADLDGVYRYVIVRLTQANLRNDEAALDECVALMQPLADAWNEIGARVPG